MRRVKKRDLRTAEKLTTVEADGGLWLVFIGDEDSRANPARQVGAIHDRGAKYAGERCNGYDVYDGWHGADPGALLGKAPSWFGALAIVRGYARGLVELADKQKASWVSQYVKRK